jgi:acyl-[acyl carrier protein]--UDP-N-acetylglucosamine O-acyltransferase
VIREFVTINAGTAQDRGVTIIGNRNWLLAYAHIAHDCVVGDNTTFSNNAPDMSSSVTMSCSAASSAYTSSVASERTR